MQNLFLWIVLKKIFLFCPSLGARVSAHIRREYRQRESSKVRLDHNLAIDYQLFINFTSSLYRYVDFIIL